MCQQIRTDDYSHCLFPLHYQHLGNLYLSSVTFQGLDEEIIQMHDQQGRLKTQKKVRPGTMRPEKPAGGLAPSNNGRTPG